MKKTIALSHKNMPERYIGEAGFSFLKALLFIIFVALIVAVVMKLMVIWVAIVAFVGAAIIVGLLANVSDIMRYMRISSM